MQWIKTNKLIVYTILFLLVFSLTRFPRIDRDTINPDGVNWHYRSQQFVNGLKYFQFDKTYQHYHPGVTLMWFTGIPVEIAKHVTQQPVYNNSNFSMFDTVAKVSLILVQFILSLFSIFLFSKLFSLEKGFLIVSLFTLEPFFIGNSRLYHLDILLTLFVLNSLLLGYLYLNNSQVFGKKFPLGLVVGLFLALSFLTKSIGIGAFVFFVFYAFGRGFISKDTHIWKKVLLVTLGFISFTFVLFPALWVDPLYYLGEIFSEGERVGIRKGHEQIVLGETTTDAGLVFYPLIILMKLSPFILLGFLASFKKTNLLEKIKSLDIYLITFYLGYFLIMLYPSKKVDRYMLVLYPFFAYFAYLGFEKFWKKSKALVLILFVVFVLYPLFRFFPYYFTYYSPIFLSAEKAHGVIAQKPFGIGMYDLKDFIVSKYGDVKLGFIDTKPMEAIYPSSKVFDIRVTGSGSYDLIILGPNEILPEELVTKFIYSNSMYINGLEYWRIYVKEIN